MRRVAACASLVCMLVLLPVVQCVDAGGVGCETVAETALPDNPGSASTPGVQPDADIIPPMSMFITMPPPCTNMPAFMMEYQAMDPLDIYTTGFGTVSGWWVHDFGMPFQFMTNMHWGQGENGEPIFGQFFVAPPEDGRYWFCTVAMDLAGNIELLPILDWAEPGTSPCSSPLPVAQVWDASTIIDRTPPSSSVTGGAPAVVNSAGPYELTLDFDDFSPQTGNTSGVSSVDLYVWTPASSGWVQAGITESAGGSDGKFPQYSLSAGDGWYRFASVASDGAGNLEALPTVISDAEFSMRLNTNSYSFPIHLGWNLVSVPCTTAGDIVTVFDDSGGDGTADWSLAQTYDASAGRWLVYDESAPSFINGFDTVTNQMGIWLKVTEVGDGLLTMSGVRPSSTAVTLRKGWNLVGYPSWDDATTVATTLTGVPYDAIQTYSSTNPYNLRNVPSSEPMHPGGGYWIHVSSDCTWTVTG